MNQNGLNEIYAAAQRSRLLQELLKDCPLTVLEQAAIRIYEADEYLLRRGDVCESFFIILEGSVTIHNVSANGKKYIMGIHHAGKCIGELEIMNSRRCISNAQARDEVKVLAVSREAYLYWLDHDRGFSRFILSMLCDKMYSFTQSTTANTLYSLRSRIAAFILDNMQSEGPDGVLYYTAEELADVMGVTARSVSRVLKDFRERNLIRMRGRMLTLQDVQGLQQERE